MQSSPLPFIQQRKLLATSSTHLCRTVFWISILGILSALSLPLTSHAQFLFRLPDSLQPENDLLPEVPLSSNVGDGLAGNPEDTRDLLSEAFTGPIIPPTKLHDATWWQSATKDDIRQLIAEIPTVGGVPITESKDRAGWTPLMRAIEGSTNVGHIQLLIDHGGKIDQRNIWGSTALMVAAGLNTNPDVISTLIRNKANLKLVNNFGMNAISYSTYFKNTPPVIARLADHQADPLVKDRTNFSAYDYALRLSALENTPLLARLAKPVATEAENKLLNREFLKNASTSEINNTIANGALVNQRNAEGRTPLHLAAEVSRDSDIIRTLLEYGASVNSRTNFGSTPLLVGAGLNPNPAIISALILAGSDLNSPNNNGTTPLIFAARRSKTSDVINLLIDHGASQKMRDDAYKTPADHIRKNSALRYGSAYSKLIAGQPILQQITYAAEDNLNATIGELYGKKQKTVVWFSSQQNGTPELVLIDLADYVGVTLEGKESPDKEGYVTVWMTDSPISSEDFLPDGYGILTMPFDKLTPDMQRPKLVESVLANNYHVFGEGLKVLGLETLPTVRSNSHQGYENFVSTFRSLEIKKSTLDSLLDMGDTIDLAFVKSFTGNVLKRSINPANPDDTIRAVTPGDNGAVTTEAYTDARMSLMSLTQENNAVQLTFSVANIGNNPYAFNLRLLNRPLLWDSAHSATVAANGDATLANTVPGEQTTITYSFTAKEGASEINELRFQLLPNGKLPYHEVWQLRKSIDEVQVFVNLQ